MTESKKRIPTGLVFLGGLLLYLCAVLPVCFKNNGLFFYYGDYNVQQVPFLILAHRAVREGRFFWNPMVDLGGNMGGMFAFYLWGSPFFWLTIPFPEEWLPYMMPFFMALKYGTAAATAYLWIRTQTRTDRAALIGAFLYAFSGFQACNIVFQHFHDVTAFFPLYLLSFDRLVEEKGARAVRGFALMTALMSVINYYFFFGQALFLILYYLVRWGVSRVREEGVIAALFEALRILLFAALGLLLSAFFLIQSIGGILGNSRVSKVLDGYDLVVYPDSTTPMAILKSFFMVPDLIARGTLFSNDFVKNGSLAFYLPCFAMAGVFSFWMIRKRDWKKTLSAVLAVMAFVPFLCASFSAMNANFYARWFYMPVLLCACMTTQALEEEECAAFTRGAALSAAVTAAFFMMCWLPVREGGKWSFTAVSENRKLLMTQVRTTALCMACLFVIVVLKRVRPALFSGGPGLAQAAGEAAAGTEVCGPGLSRAAGEAAAAAEACGTGGPGLSRAAGEAAAAAEACGTGGPGLAQAAEACEVGGPGLARAAGEAAPGTEVCGPEFAQVPERAAPFGEALPPDGLLRGVCLLLVLLCCLLSTKAVLKSGCSLISHRGFEKWKRQMLTERPVLEKEGGEEKASGSEEPFFRVETDGTSTNYEMVWGLPTMHCFESTIHPSIFTWYRGIGMIRTVESTLPLERIGARAVMSVRYYLENTLVVPEKSYTDQGGMYGYRLVNDENGYNVYETKNYIPMGFTFENYMTEDNYDRLRNGVVSDRVLVKDLILSDEMAGKYGYLMTEDADSSPGEMSFPEFGRQCQKRRESACEEFSFDKNGWHALARMERDNLLFFSIPYDEGFTVTVDGEPAKLERVNFGLSAVFVPKGSHKIRAVYLPEGFKEAFFVSLSAAVLLILLPLLSAVRRRYLFTPSTGREQIT